MALVIDANSANLIAAGKCNASKKILFWVRTKGKVISGGKLQRELAKTNLKPLISSWSAAGRFALLPSDLLMLQERALADIPIQSDDLHVLVVVMAGNGKVIVTGDKQLMRDLKNPNIVGVPRKIIRNQDGALSRPGIVDALLRAC